jgi:predicted metallopeptidase
MVAVAKVVNYRARNVVIRKNPGYALGAFGNANRLPRDEEFKIIAHCLLSVLRLAPCSAQK